MKRRHFLTQFVLAIMAVACGANTGGGSVPIGGNQPVMGACSTKDPFIFIVANHGHTLFVPISDVMNGIGNVYTTSISDATYTGSPHSHTLTVGASDMHTLKTNYSMTLNTSFNEGHSHSVSLTCVG